MKRNEKDIGVVEGSSYHDSGCRTFVARIELVRLGLRCWRKALQSERHEIHDMK